MAYHAYLCTRFLAPAFKALWSCGPVWFTCYTLQKCI